MSEHSKQRWRTTLSWFTFIALAVLCYFIRDQIYATLKNLQNINLFALAMLIPVQVGNYHAQARLYGGVFELLGHKLRYGFLYRLSLELNFINNVFPSAGVSGFSYLGLRLRRHGISAAKTTVSQMMKLILIFISFEILLFVGLLFLAIGGQANDLVILVAGSVTTLLFVGTFGVGYIIGSKKRINAFFIFITKAINKIVHSVRRSKPETINIEKAHRVFDELNEHYVHLQRNYKQLFKPLMYALLANTFEIIAIYSVYVAFDHWVNPGAVILAYAIANFAGVISVLPGGIGVYEALMTGVLATAGVPPALSIPVTVTYRIFNMLIQLPPGYYFYHKALNVQQESVIEEALIHPTHAPNHKAK